MQRPPTTAITRSIGNATENIDVVATNTMVTKTFSLVENSPLSLYPQIMKSYCLKGLKVTGNAIMRQITIEIMAMIIG